MGIRFVFIKMDCKIDNPSVIACAMPPPLTQGRLFYLLVFSLNHRRRKAAVTAEGAVENFTKMAEREMPSMPTMIMIMGCFSI